MRENIYQQHGQLWMRFIARARIVWGDSLVERDLLPFQVDYKQTSRCLRLVVVGEPHLSSLKSAQWKERILKWAESQDSRIKAIEFFSRYGVEDPKMKGAA